MLYAFKSLKDGKPSNCLRTIRIISNYYFLSAKKWNLRSDTYQKTFCNNIFDISQYLLDPCFVLDLRPFTELFDTLRKTLVSRSSWIPLTLHVWKFMYDKTWNSWGHCAFVLRVRWSLRELLPLKLYNFYAKIWNL
jgi:hypothetical protein